VICENFILLLTQTKSVKASNAKVYDLTEWRETVITKLVDEFEKELEITNDYEQAMSNIIFIYLSKDANNNFHPFFTTIRSHFEEDAEQFLKDNNYNG